MEFYSYLTGYCDFIRNLTAIVGQVAAVHDSIHFDNFSISHYRSCLWDGNMMEISYIYFFSSAKVLVNISGAKRDNFIKFDIKMHLWTRKKLSGHEGHT